MGRKCSVEGCNNKHYGKGYCSKHYLQMYRYGKIFDKKKFNPNEIIIYEDYAEIIVNKKNEVSKVIIDIDDVDKVKNIRWSLTNGYVENAKFGRLHRYLMNCPSDMVVDHINHNPLDNRKSNLRICSQQENCMNKTKRSDNTSGVVGVCWNKQKDKWMARITVDKKTIHLGLFTDIEEAIEVRRKAEIEYFGEYRNI